MEKMNLCVHHMIDTQVAQTPDKIALLYEDQTLTYLELDERSNQVANHLLRQNVTPDTVIGLCIERSLDMVVSLLGILKAGAAYLPLDPGYPKDRLIYMANDSKMALLVTQEIFIDLFVGITIPRICMDRDRPLISGEEKALSQHSVTADNLAYVLYTSGSTGQPKGVAMGHRPLSNLLQWQMKNSFASEEVTTLQFAPLSFDVSFQEIFSTLSTGGTLVLLSDDLRLNSIKLLKFINTMAVERLFLPFIALQHLAEVAIEHELTPSTLKEVITAGEQLQITRHIVSFFTILSECKLINQYGPSETHVVTSYELTGLPENWDKLPPIGKPIDNTKGYILDEELKQVTTGESGELCIGGLALARGYLHRAELTRRRFIRDPFTEDPDGRLYKTGDLARYNASGDIEFLGRIDNQVKIRGYRIELGELEVILSSHHMVRQAAVKDIDDDGERTLVAYVIFESGESCSTTALREYLSKKLPAYMIPSSFVFLDEFPRTPSGKIDRKSLPKPERKRPEIEQEYVVPVTSIEKLLADVWCHLLKVDKVGIKDSFFDLGGDSLKALNMVVKLQAEKGIDLPIVKLFQYQNIERLAQYLENKDDPMPLFERVYDRALRLKNKNAQAGKMTESVAIIGMAGRFPGAGKIDELWDVLSKGKETVTFFSDNEINGLIAENEKEDPSYIKARGIISEADSFDAGFFNISALEAQLMDPQQRVFLETAWSAFEDSGYDPESCSGLVGVFAGMANNTYFMQNVMKRPDLIERYGRFQTMLINEKDYLATRVAYKFNLSGPCTNVYTACSTSLVAVCQAFNALIGHQCDMALAGGVTITAPIKSGYLFQEGGMYSADGHTRPFDAEAAGTVFSDGCGAVVLKRLSDAIEDGDHIYSVIRSVATNNDGSDKASFTAPSIDGQASVIAMAQSNAGIEPGSISYVEAHGTATPVGDPIEFEALTRAFTAGTQDRRFCAIGSIKSNFGHLNAAAGVAGLIKASLALFHDKIPPMVNFKQPNQEIDLSESPFYINTEPADWGNVNQPKRAGVSSFGVGGTNAHVILEEAPKRRDGSKNKPYYCLPFSAKTPEALTAIKAQLHQHLSRKSIIDIGDVAYTLSLGRKKQKCRGYIVCSDQKEACKLLLPEDSSPKSNRAAESGSLTTVFMFPGQGTQYVNMGLSLYKTEPKFCEIVDECADILRPHLGLDIRRLIYPDKNSEADCEKRLKETLIAQPALFTIEYALAGLLIDWGIKPQAMIGHSIGEIVAAAVSGVFTLEGALEIVANRGRLMNALPGGSMISIRLPQGQVGDLLNENLTIAAVNGPKFCVVSGSHEDVQKLKSTLDGDRIPCMILKTSHAFHSNMMEPAVDPFAVVVNRVDRFEPQIPFISNVHGRWIKNEEAMAPAYWAKQIRSTVQFSRGIQTITESVNNFLIETGPRITTIKLARSHPGLSKKNLLFGTLGEEADEKSELTTILDTFGKLWTAGVTVNWENFYRYEERNRVSLPTYPFERKRYWVEPVFRQTDDEPTEPAVAVPEHFKQQIEEVEVREMSVNRRDKIIVALKDIFEESSGEDLENIDLATTFFEIGFDSLLLTQISLSIQNKFDLKVTFRQIAEDLVNLDVLSEYIDLNLPADAYNDEVDTTGVIARAIEGEREVQYNVRQTAVEQLLFEQMRIMKQQLEVLRQGGCSPETLPVSPVAAACDTSGFSSTIQEKPNVEKKEPRNNKKRFGAGARIDVTRGEQLNNRQQEHLNNFISQYNKKTAGSKRLTESNRSHLADPRVVSGFRPIFKELVYPVVVDSSSGAKLWDVDGNEYVDITCGFGSNFFGYLPPFIRKAIDEQLEKGIEIGPQHPLAGIVAKKIADITKLERVAFCNTGSEAVLGALRLARTATRRNTVAFFSGAYHGIFDEVISRGSKKLRSIPAAPGIPPSMVENALILDYGTEKTLNILRSRADELAAILVEPVQSRHPDLQPTEFLREIREITKQSDSALIFDEVITGFRIHPGGAQAHFGIQADIATYGKIVGAGLPIGIIAGNRRFMDGFDGGPWKFGDSSFPEIGVTYFAGTFVRHPLALAAANAALDYLSEHGPELQSELNRRTDEMVTALNSFFKNEDAPLKMVSFGSLFKPKFTKALPFSELFFPWLRNKGIHIWNDRPCFLTIAHTDEDVDFIIQAIQESVVEMKSVGFLGDQVTFNDTVDQYDPNRPPVPGAKLGRNPDGTPSWFIADPDRPMKFLRVES